MHARLLRNMACRHTPHPPHASTQELLMTPMIELLVLGWALFVREGGAGVAQGNILQEYIYIYGIDRVVKLFLYTCRLIKVERTYG